MENWPITVGPARSDRAWVPAKVCALPTTEQPMRVAQFDELFAAALRDISEADGSGLKARLVLAGGEDLLARVQRLVDAETWCCSFFTLTLTPLELEGSSVTETVVALDIEVPAARADVLAALVNRARAVQVAS